MKSLFALLAAVAVIATSSSSFACRNNYQGGRNPTIEPISHQTVQTVKSKATR